MTQGEKKKKIPICFMNPPRSFQAVIPCEGFAHLAGLPLTAHRSGSLTTPCPYQDESLQLSAEGMGALLYL